MNDLDYEIVEELDQVVHALKAKAAMYSTLSTGDDPMQVVDDMLSTIIIDAWMLGSGRLSLDQFSQPTNQKETP